MTTQRNLEIFLGGFAKVCREQWEVDLRLKSLASVHKLVLAARSEVFKKMVESDMFKASNTKTETVTLNELNQEELEAFVEFIYNNGSVLSEKEKKHVQSLYKAAEKYENPYLLDLCRNELRASLNLSNVLNVLELSLIPFDKTLYDSAVIFIIRNLRSMCDFAKFKAFVGRNPDLSVEIIRDLTRKLYGQYVSY